jgi:hypothetical protein
LIIYGSIKINEYAFYLGFNKLELSYTHLDLQSLIYLIIYLIRGITFRPKYITSPLNGLSLNELINIYYTREAIKAHDIMYALLNMNSDPNVIGLSLDYTVS